MSDAQSQHKVHFIGPTASFPREPLPSFRLYNSQFLHRQFKHEHPDTHQCRLESFKEREDNHQWPVFLLSFGIKETFASVAALNQKPQSDNDKLRVIMGSRGTKEGEFLFPQSVCFHPDNDDVIIADTENERIQIFNSSGVFKTVSESQDKEISALPTIQRPRRVIGLPNNRIAISDSSNPHIFIYQGKIPRVRYVIPTSGLPLAMTCTSEKVDDWELFVLTDQEKIEGFGKTKKQQTSMSVQHSCPKRTQFLPHMAVDHHRHLLFINEPHICRIFIYHLSHGSGELIHSFGLLPCLSGLTMQPAGLAFMKSTAELIVADSLNHTVNAYSCVSGELTRCLLSPSDKLGSVHDMAISADETLLVAIECDILGKHQAKVFHIFTRPSVPSKESSDSGFEL